jgi:putative flippase GtrA
MVAKSPSKNRQKIRFLLVGGTNTAIDFGLLFILNTLGLPRVLSNTISTGVAFIFSFFANRNFTFSANSGNIKKQMTLFIIVTLFGLWVIQPIIISLISNLLVGKIIATAVTLVWNYLFYSRLVFKKEAK